MNLVKPSITFKYALVVLSTLLYSIKSLDKLLETYLLDFSSYLLLSVYVSHILSDALF